MNSAEQIADRATIEISHITGKRTELENIKTIILQALQEREQVVRAEYKALAHKWLDEHENNRNWHERYYFNGKFDCADEIEGIK